MLDYLLKSGICLTAFFLFYKLFLEKETIHIFKRFYLLGGLLLAFSIPLITFTTTVQVAPVELSPITYSEITFEPALIEETEAEVKNFWPLILWTVYGFGVVLFGLKFLFNLFQIGSKIRKNPNQKAKGFTHVLLQHLITPHTFFSYIFLNKQQYEERKIPQEVFWHEETHAKQKHSLDVVVIEFLQVVFWFNPLLYFIKKDIKLNHEFLADSAVLNKGVSLTAYQEILLAFSINSTEPVLANALNYSSIKKRFTIMKTKTSQKTTWIKSLILLPLVAVLVYSFSEKKIVEVEAQNSLIQSNLEEVNKLKVNYSTTQDTKVPDIEININHNKEILINGKNYATIKTLKKQIEKIIKDYTPDQISKLKTIIEADATIKMGFIIDIEIQLRDAGIKKRELKYYDVNTEIHKNQRKATPAQIIEYNTLAKEYNKQPEYRRVVKMKDYNRMEYIFNKMTIEQKQYAETFPNLPPPPPTPTTKSIGLLNKQTTQRSKDSLTIPLSNKLGVPNKTYDSYEYKNRVYVGRKAFYVNDSLTPTSTSLSRKQNLKQDALENYIIKNNKYEKTRNEEPHYKDRSLSEQKELDNSFSELNNLYNSLSRENQQKTKRPIYPLMPYIKIMKDGKKYYKKESELTKEDWALLPPPPPPPVMSQDMINTGSKELQKANKKLLEEAKSYGLAVRNQKGTAKNNNEINVKYKKTMELYKVYRELAIAEGFLPTPPPPPPAPANKTDHIIEWAKRGALFYYEDKKITSDKAIEITKKNSSINIETLGTGSRKPIVKLSKKPITVEK